MAAVFNPDGNIAFMTTKERELFPTKMANDRFGNQTCPITGTPQTGPGCYDFDRRTTLTYELDRRVVSIKGYSLGARTGPRIAKYKTFDTPCPTEYQQHFNDERAFETSHKPFQIGSDRFPLNKSKLINVVPGAGTYEHEIHSNRKVLWHQSFGGSPVQLPAVTLRSTIDRNTGKLYSTKEEKKYQRKLAYLKLYY